MRIVIVGAGSVGRSIARELLDNGHQVAADRPRPDRDRVVQRPRGAVAARRRLRDRLAGRGGAGRLRRGGGGQR